MVYVNLIIDNNNDNTDRFFTYGCHDEEIKVGQRVTVPFSQGNKKLWGYVFSVMKELPAPIRGLKYVESIDEDVTLTQEIIDTCLWMKKRYLCRNIECINCFTPGGKPSKTGKKRIPYKDLKGEAQLARTLTEEQRKALLKMTPAIEKHQYKAFLLHGVTGSGKTEVYMRIIAECLEKGRTAIMMVPEISLTRQVIERFVGRFGNDAIAVLHSRLSLGERYDEWVRIRTGQVKIVIGARSAVFAPLENIGAIVLDEEHEATYKSDKTPKYETVEVALKRAKAHKGILVLGSATPSVATYERADEGIFERLELTQRYNSVPLPKVTIADMRRELKNGNTSIFSTILYGEMKRCLEEKKQMILFLNRRGYSTFVSCRECGYVMKCPDCGISLTYHKNENRAKCHYCGYSVELPKQCPQCESKKIRHFGTGTEKVEEAVKEMFPEARTLRLDLDTIKKKGSMDEILEDFKNARADVLIGTQLVAKGLDFSGVSLVGVVSADSMLNIPDFRSPERTFQLVTQAAGRAGRGDKVGTVIIQTYSPEHYAVMCAAKQDYQEFFNTEIMMRKAIGYPPFCDLIQIIFSSGDEKEAISGAEKWAVRLTKALGQDGAKNMFGPNPAPMNKIQDTFRFQIFIKCPKGRRVEYSSLVEEIKKETGKNKKSQYTVSVDINPYSFV